MDDKIITRAYILHTGELNFNQTKFSNFLSAYPGLMEKHSKAALQRMIRANIVEVSQDLNPNVDSNELADLIGLTDTETKDFLITINNKPLIDVANYFSTFRFKSAHNRKNIKRALFAVYGQEAADLGMGVLGGDAPDMAPVSDTPADAPVPPEPKDEITDMEAAPGDSEQPTPATSLDPAVEEDAIFTIEGYLQTDVFNSRLIPNVRVVKAEKLKNGYVLHIEFASKDNQSKAYATTVVHNKKLVLPAELYSDEGMSEKIGDFDQDTLNQVFTVAEQKKSIPTDNYGELMDQMVQSPSTVEANVILEKILKKFGQEVAAGAWESYIRRKAHQGQKSKDTAASRLKVKLAEDQEAK